MVGSVAVCWSWHLSSSYFTSNFLILTITGRGLLLMLAEFFTLLEVRFFFAENRSTLMHFSSDFRRAGSEGMLLMCFLDSLSLMLSSTN